MAHQCAAVVSRHMQRHQAYNKLVKTSPYYKSLTNDEIIASHMQNSKMHVYNQDIYVFVLKMNLTYLLVLHYF